LVDAFISAVKAWMNQTWKKEEEEKEGKHTFWQLISE